MLHFSQVWPLDAGTAEYLTKARKTIIVEGNATGQLAKLIKQTTGCKIDHKILNYSGLTFSVEQLQRELTKCL